MYNMRWLKDHDFFLIAFVLLLCGAGLLAISSVAHSLAGGGSSYVYKQAVCVGIGVAVMCWIRSLDYRTLVRHIEMAYWVCIVLLIVVFFCPPINGAHGWITLPGGFAIEPSEFFKIVFVLMLAKYLGDDQQENEVGRQRDWKHYLKLTSYGAAGLALIIIEPELGQSLMILSTVVAVLFVHLPRKTFVISTSVAASLLSLVLILCFALPDPFLHSMKALEDKGVLKQHQYDRIESFIYPENNLGAEGFQVYQAKVAIGSGQFFGKGLYQGSQTQGNWVPEQRTDFIFSMIGEELGFLGTVTVVFLYFLMAFRIISVGSKASDRMGMYICAMIASMFAFQIFENIGMNLQIVPMTGVTLPFISYGGSSLLTNFILIGLVLSVRARHRRLRF